ncbi:putative sterol-4-alpha-carboxylate 3-dehydrogenase, decarboxylating [Cucurbitaria berberidis CBS 394.84]|uniref:Sterol-4-alpha-carboxylate 3-dehydrogenase, decarboxylating n=1 Tax=Cucurbitaria berberidis CBS 394.84 TaxID=1168544 RepID=A0A9P4GED8_9PLEO|nr:putative sterol-4-alpha-carboxylate 3-dehydrogenase, decarboxylating [Cucurbitaria berberidis CBS 394.84]KAF1844458.1 putative sterol-4-alpha-carboxylate 3-dehydrogenase, decarboxylating [Cucurbitaria berberidis CBS 394.84]
MNRSSRSDIALGRVFVTGGCGLLGFHIVKFLVENGHSPNDIFVFDISTKNNRFSNGVTYITGDIGSKSDVGSALDQAKPSVIINTASPDAIRPGRALFERCNILGVQNVIECAQERGIRVLVHTSSSEVAQDGYHDLVWLKEVPVLDNPVDGSVYARSKAIGETIVLGANRQKGLLTTAIRLTTMMGENDMILTKHFLDLGKSGKIKFQIGQGRNLYDFIYGGNAAECHILAAQALLRIAQSDKHALENEEKRVDGESFNLSNGDPWPFWQAARFVCKEGGYPIAEEDVWKMPIGVLSFFMVIWESIYWLLTLGGTPPVTLKMMKYTAQRRTFDITKAKERLGYVPRVSVAEGFRRGVHWHLAREKKL